MLQAFTPASLEQSSQVGTFSIAKPTYKKKEGLQY